ncbi:glycerophosphodiester phosphodiesterase family protein [uncultured Croceitalea sp.]|uniref:glycerophosphodiester phosphodiesterase family protein n=1 Tax=uncultured Croceitalea sp. TaxID=1798908 RepID=UPI003305AF22
MIIASIKPSIRLVTLIALFFTTITCLNANSYNIVNEENGTKGLLVLQSNSFNAKKKSNFSLNGLKEQIDRGLTIVHFHSNEKFEYRTYDTHGSTEEAMAMTMMVTELFINKAKFIILGHDSAAKSLSDNTTTLRKLGLSSLSTIKSRQAYIMHNLTGEIVELLDDTSIDLIVEVPKTIKDEKIYFPKEVYNFEPNTNRYIAHAGGEVNGIKSTNTKDALDESYAKGFRLFELDIISTSDGKLVAAHDWGMWSRFTDYKGELPPSHEEFKKHKIYGDYTTLDLNGINDWFKAHPDATLVTDKLNDPIAFAESFVDKDRLIMELFSIMAAEEAASYGLNAMISQIPFMGIKGDKLDFLKINNIKYIALSRRMIKREKKLLVKLRDAGIKVYVYHVNFDAGKDEKYVYENEIGLVYGMYADKWAFDSEEKKEASK